MRRSRWFIWVMLATFGLLLAGMVWFASFYKSYLDAHKNDPHKPGVTFSILYAEELDLDWKETYLALLNDLGIKYFRLTSYWDQIEPEDGKFSFEELDFQMQQAEAKGAKVSLAIGLRQPRWPECHQPAWVDKLEPAEQQKRLEGFMTAVVERYRSSPALETYQLENEALNTAFGECQNFDRARLVREFDMVKRLDPKHPIIVSVSNEYGLPLGQPRGDIVGFSIYHRVYDATITKRYVSYPFPPWWFTLRAALIERTIGRTSMIHELQTEPWGPRATSELSIEEQSKSMDAKRVLENVEYAKQTGIKEYYLWGGEWWYWRMVKFGDHSLWDAAKQIYKD